MDNKNAKIHVPHRMQCLSPCFRNANCSGGAREEEEDVNTSVMFVTSGFLLGIKSCFGRGKEAGFFPSLFLHENTGGFLLVNKCVEEQHWTRP